MFVPNKRLGVPYRVLRRLQGTKSPTAGQKRCGEKVGSLICRLLLSPGPLKGANYGIIYVHQAILEIMLRRMRELVYIWNRGLCTEL